MSHKSAKSEVTDYRMSIHMGICAAGDGLELIEIKIGDKVAWSGTADNPDLLVIDEDNLFGGNEKEGGAVGFAWWLPGRRSQVLPEPLARRLGGTSSTIPGFRGLASIFFTGASEPGLMPTLYEGTNGIIGKIADLFASISQLPRGFKWATNNPYLKDVTVRVFRPPETDLDPAYAVIPMGLNSNGRMMRGVNPAHVTYEVMTNKDWGGMQGDSSSIDLDSFEAASKTLYDEKFAYRQLWTRETDSYSFLSAIMDHISARLRPDPASGLYKLTLLRNDYDISVLPTITPDNAVMTNPPTRRAWGDIVNEVKVSWTNPESGQQETVSAQDPAAIAIQGGIISTTKSFEGIGTQDTAIRVAERELTAGVQPLMTCSVSVTREFWDTVTADVVKLSWPEYGIKTVIMRVITVGFSGRRIVLGLAEDVFGFDRGSYLSTSSTRRSNAVAPAPLVNYHFGTAPAFFTVSALELTDADGLVYPEVLPMPVVAPGTNDDNGYRLIGFTTDSLGSARQVNLGDKPLQGSWKLVEDLPAEAQSTFRTGLDYLGPEIEVGDYLLISDGTDTNSEIGVISEITDLHWVLERGVMDTVPQFWPAGTRAWTIPENAAAPDATVRSVGEVVQHKHRTKTSSGTLLASDAPTRSATMTNRPYRPLRPAAVTLNGVAFKEVDLGAGNTLTVVWANRNRVTESGQLALWNDADVAGEDGQTTKITVYAEDMTVITTYTGLTGTSYTFPRSDLAGESVVYVKVTSKVGARESLQGFTFRVVNGAVNLALSGDQAGDKLSYSGDQSADRLNLGDF